MATSIKLKHSNTIATIPTTSDLIAGEVALNTVDKKFYVRNGSSSVVTLANHYATDFDTNVITFKVVGAIISIGSQNLSKWFDISWRDNFVFRNIFSFFINNTNIFSV